MHKQRLELQASPLIFSGCPFLVVPVLDTSIFSDSKNKWSPTAYRGLIKYNLHNYNLQRGVWEGRQTTTISIFYFFYNRSAMCTIQMMMMKKLTKGQ